LTGVTDMKNIGKWYDPISQRWIVPRQTTPVTSCGQSTVEHVREITRRCEVERIWHLLVDCCASG
jgi:hypothetical protein